MTDLEKKAEWEAKRYQIRELRYSGVMVTDETFLAADAELTALRAEVERLRKVADDAIAFAMEGWAYAGEYFKTKWNYEGELADLRRRAYGEG